jgi:hypothetical protein
MGWLVLGSRPSKVARDWRKAAWSSTSMTLAILIALMMTAFNETLADESVMIFLRSLFIGVRGRGILGRSYTESCIEYVASKQ